MSRRLFCPLLALALSLGLSTVSAEIPAGQLAFFETNVRPVLADRCYSCHSVEEKQYKGGLSLDTREGLLRGGDSGPAIVPKNPKASLLIKAVSHSGNLKMPKKTAKLSSKEIANLTRWIAMGAPDPREADAAPTIQSEIDYEAGRTFWSFQPLAKTQPPAVKTRDWPRAGLDHYILAGLEAKQLTPVGDADKAALLRRVYFDLIGLPPNPQQLRDFLADDSDDAFAKVVDDLLTSSHFGERWGRHWMDVARYAESSGMERNYTFSQAWRYRDYVIDAFNRDVPYDQFVREQIAGELLLGGAKITDANRDERDRLLVATGFLAMGPKSLNERDKKQFKADIVDEQIDVSTRAVMGLTVACARCHDHKFDPISQEDYYALAGFFQSSDTKYGTVGGGGNRQPSTLMAIGNADEAIAKALEEQQERIAKAEQTKRRMTIQVNQAKQAMKVAKGPERTKTSAELKSASKKLKEVNASLARLKKAKPKVDSQCMGVRDLPNCADTSLAIRGDVHRLAQRVPRGFLQVMTSESPDFGKSSSGRLELAAWMSARDNPLTARVMVNRMWHHLFGQGLVRTVDNFGATGERPVNPALLDHLAQRFLDHDWSVKAMLREIALSRSYQLASEHDARAYEIDPDNRLVWQQSHRRLDAEAIRDAMMLASGELLLSPREKSAVNAVGEVNIGRDVKVLAKLRAPSPHRSVYLPIVRNLVPEALAVFDFAEPSMLVGRRNVTTVPSQALYLLNSKEVERLAEKMAASLQDGSPSERLDEVFQKALCRTPTTVERKQFGAFIAECKKQNLDPWANVCQTMFASAEFRYLD